MLGLYSPAAHNRHAVLPSLGLYVPAAQSEQEKVEAGENLPAAHV